VLSKLQFVDLYRHDITFGDDSKCFPSINVA
jgi:hypothetical protein